MSLGTKNWGEPHPIDECAPVEEGYGRLAVEVDELTTTAVLCTIHKVYCSEAGPLWRWPIRHELLGGLRAGDLHLPGSMLGCTIQC